MNLLWDLRLFSYGYGQRGVGRFCTEMIRCFPLNRTDLSITIWGDRKKTPDFLNNVNAEWISYADGDWKTDLYKIPWIIQNKNIDLFHYWVALGPIWKIGLGAFHQCKSLITVYDLGVELWNLPHSMAVKKSRYWMVQKMIAAFCNSALCISNSVCEDLKNTIPKFRNNIDVVYMPSEVNKTECDNKREKYFITLGGSLHKNCYRVLKAFSLFKKLYPEYELIVLGEFEQSEIPDNMETVIRFESMVNYEYHLSRCSGLIFCSLYEGLGIPPIEAMKHCCPLILSDIPTLHETCKDLACFVDPLDVQSIANGMEIIIKDVPYWVKKSFDGGCEYEKSSSFAGEKLFNIYTKITDR